MPFGGLMAASAGIGALANIWGANKAAKAQVRSAQIAADTQRQFYQQGREDLAPWRGAGGEAVGQMRELLLPGGWAEQQYDASTFAQDPGVAFRMQQGQQALERSAAARGGTLSGGALKSLAGYSQGLASQEYGAAYNRWNQERQQRWGMLSGLAGMGLNAAGTTASMGQNAAGQISGAQMGAGNAQAAGYLGTGNAISGAANNYMQMYMMHDLFGEGGAMSGAPQGNAGTLSRMGMMLPAYGAPPQSIPSYAPFPGMMTPSGYPK